MKRRHLVLGAGAASILPRMAFAQKKPAKVGWLYSGSLEGDTGKQRAGFLAEGLRAVDLVEGRDFVLDVRHADGNYDRFPALVEELAKAGARIIVVNTIAAVRAAQQLTPPLPVVMAAINDPVGNGLVASLARPGGHTTGLTTLNEDLLPKSLEFGHAIAPGARKLGLLSNPANPSNPQMVERLAVLGRALDLGVEAVPIRTSADLDDALAAMAAAKPDLLQLLPDAANLDLADKIAAFAIDRRLPFFCWPEVVDFGGLFGYGPSERSLFRRAAYYVKRILDGANPADLPVEQPTQIELTINLKTARAIGVTIPPTLLARADRVIE